MASLSSETPNRARIFQLSERLTGLQNGLQGERSQRLEAVELRLKALDERIVSQQDSEEERFGALKVQVGKLQDLLDEEKSARELLAESKRKEHAIADARLQFATEQEVSARTKSSRDVTALLVDSVEKIRSEVLAEAEEMRQSQARQLHAQQSRLPRLRESLEEELAGREVMEARLSERINEELDKVHVAILTEKRAREDTEEALLLMLGDVVGRLQGELELERRDRENTEAMLMTFLEDTCLKIGDAHAL